MATDPAVGAPSPASLPREQTLTTDRARQRAPEYGVAVSDSAKGWTFLTNHGHVLVCLAVDPDARLRDIAERVGITERAVQQIVAELEQEGYVAKERVGRRNHYAVVREGRFRHPLEEGLTVGAFLDVVLTATSR